MMRCAKGPLMGAVLGRLEARRKRCAPLAGKSTLNRLEHAPAEPDRYRKIGHDPKAIEALFVDLFLDAHESPPKEIVLDLDATDTPLHGDQDGKVFHGYTTATAICRCLFSAANICWRRSCAVRTSMAPPERWRRPRGSWRASGNAGLK
jgi:hypothetical protein